ncbi:MAG: leucine-rich repeat domain-containing protein [Oscillospiraceae bacterium]|nr:leucine-rich repeat domain-containing protein [Oscillospiraceae bacterium]
MKKIRKGFTLVEVICVLTIIAIIAAIAVPNISGYIEKSKINNCRSIMTDFVNDLEYKIVSKRYYDINELNDALENCIKEAGGERKSDSKINGICPNGGEYALSWTITPGKPDENSKIYTAKVEVSNCVCECLGTDENAVVHTGHEFTAALVSSEYFDDGKTIEDKYNEIIEGIIDDVENSKKSTSDLDGIVDEVDTKNPEYIIAGVTTTLDKKVEWISVYYHDTFSTKENKYKFLTKSKGKLIVKDLTETQFNDKLNWPPAEGTCGSAVFKEGWNKDINYFVGGINYADTNNVKIGWIQRDGSWYVQSNSEVDGINIDVSSKETNDFQHIISENKVDTSKGLSVSARQPIVAETNFANSFSVSPSYTGTEDKPGFGHIEYSSESKYIKNGYIITDVSVIDSNGNWPTWAGVFCGTDLTDRTNLEKILKQEGTLISEFQNGYKDSLVIAYQEYYKSYDEAGKTYTYTPFTVYEVIDKTDESTFKGTDIKYTKSDTEKFEIDNLKVFVNEDVKVKLPTGKVEDLACIKRREVYHITDSSKEGYFFVPSGQTIDVYPEGGDQSIIDKLNSGAYSADIWYQNPPNGTIHKVGTASTTKKGITLDYKAGTDDSSFEIGKLEITGEFELKIQKNGSTDYLPDTGVVKTDVKHIKSKDNENGFYISDSNNTDGNEIIKKINSSVGSGNIYYYDSESKTSEIIGSLSSDFSLSADYDNAVDKVFRLEGLTVNANYTINVNDSTISVNDSTMTIASVKHSEKLEHFSDNGGYLISINPDHAGKITEQNDSDTLNALKSAYKGDIYIDYTDVEIRSTKVTVDTRAVITAPDYVFYTLSDSESTRYVYVDSYIGNSDTMDIPRTINGYWLKNTEPADSSNPYVKVSVDNDQLYYVDDGKESVIKQIGKPESLPVQSYDSRKILKNNTTVKNVSLENCDADTITSYAFYNGRGIRNLNIGTKVVSIGEGAFQNCNGLNDTKSLTIPETVTSIGKYAFNNFVMNNGTMYILGCTDLVVSDSTSQSSGTGNTAGAVTINGLDYDAVIEKDVFQGIHVNSLVIGGKVEKIGEDAFQDINFNKINDKASLTIKDNVETIGASAFKGAGFSSGLVIGDKVKYIEASAFEGCNTYSGTLDLNNVAKIGQNAFKGCTNITGGLVIPETVESIGKEAFDSFASYYDNNNNDGNIGKLVINGGSYKYTVEENVTKYGLGGLIFTNAKFNGVTIGGNVTKIAENAFANIPYNSSTPYNNIKGSLIICDSVTEIGENAFNGCSYINKLKLSTKLKTISNRAFYGCSGLSENLVIPDSVESIGTEAFKECTGFNGTLTLGNGLKTIGAEAFAYCKRFQGGLTVPVSVTGGIGDLAFRDFAGETSSPGILELKSGSYNSGKSIGAFIFTGAKFTGITIGGNVENIGMDAFHHGGKSNGDDSITADYSKITGPVVLNNTVKTIEDRAFLDCTGLNGTISLPEVTTIGAHAFENCSNLTGIAELKSVQTIGDSAFKNCSKMSGDLSFPSTLTSIGSSAFYNGSSIGLVSIPDSVTSIGSSAFENSGSGRSLTIYGCSGKDEREVGVLGDGTNSIFKGSHYSNITIGGSVKIIKEYAFQYGGRLSGKLDIRGEVQEIRKLAFDTCDNLTELSLDNGHIQKIYEGAFARCRRVEGGLYIPKTVNYMERCAFKQFAELTPPEKLGELKVYGTSDANGNLGNPDLNSDGAPLFSSAHFKNVTIGGNVKIIHHDQFNNKLYYDFGDNIKDTQGNVISSPIKGDDNYDFSGIVGDLIIEDGVTQIGTNSFFAMQFDNVSIPESVSVIGVKAFSFAGTGNGSLTVRGSSDDNFTLGNGKDPIFLGSKFNGVTIGGRVKHIGNDLFHNMDNYSDYTCEEEINKQKVNVHYNYTYSDIKGKLTIEDVVETIGQSAFESCNFDGRLLLGEKEGSVKLNTIDKYAFKNCKNFTGDLVIPYSINTVDSQAFFCFAKQSSNPGQLILWAGTDSNGSVLKGAPYDGAKFRNMIVTGTKIKKINDYAFSCEQFNDNITREGFKDFTGKLEINTGKDANKIEVGVHAFYGCTGFDDTLNISSVNKIGDGAFYNCVNFSEGLIIPYGMNGIGNDAFYRFARETDNPGMFELWSGTRVDNDFQYLSGQPFRGAKFKDMLVHGSVNVIENDAFNSYNITDSDDFRNFTGSLRFTSKTEIGSYAFCCDTGFDGELLFGVDQEGKGVSRIGEGAFAGCTNFYKNYTKSDNSQAVFTIPETVTEIKANAFESMCSGITDMDRIPKLEILGASLTTTDSNGNITEKAFGSTGPWNANTQKYDTITIFKNAKFNNVYIGGNVHTIAEYAFDNSNGIYDGITGDIEINSKNIWAYSFYKMHTNHDHRGSLILGDNVQNIGDYAFADTKFFGNVSGERKLIIPYNVSFIGSSAFRNFCSGFGNPPSLTVRGYASMDVEGRGNGYRRSDGKNYCDIFEYSCFNNVTFEGNAKIIGTGAFNNSGGQYNGWTGTLTFNTGVEYVYTGAFKPHKFSNIMMNQSVKRGGQGINIKEWTYPDKIAVFDPHNNFKTFN